MGRILLSVCLLSVSAWSQTITVTSPAAGAVWKQGETKVIQWTNAGQTGANVRITLRVPGQTGAALEIVQSTPNTGSYSWTVPTSVAPGTYTLRVRSTVPVQGDSGEFQIQESGGGGGSTISRPFLRSKVQASQSSILKIDVFFPPEGTRMNIGEGMIVQWETAIPGPYFIDLMSEDGHTLVTHLCEGAGNNIGGNKWIQGNIHPENNTQVVLPTGYYRFKVRGSRFGGGLGPKVHITGPQVEVLEQLEGSYRDRHSRRRIDTDYDWQPNPSVFFSRPGTARVGGSFEFTLTQSSRYWVGYIFRSQVVFPVDQIDMSHNKTLKDAWIYIQEKYEGKGRIGEACGNEPYPFPTARGWRVYGLTGPWSGPCIETPGTQVGEIPGHVDEQVIYITDLVRGWLDGTKPNHGLIIGSRFEPFPDWSCFYGLSWYKVILNMKFTKDKAS